MNNANEDCQPSYFSVILPMTKGMLNVNKEQVVSHYILRCHFMSTIERKPPILSKRLFLNPARKTSRRESNDRSFQQYKMPVSFSDNALTHLIINCGFKYKTRSTFHGFAQTFLCTFPISRNC